MQKAIDIGKLNKRITFQEHAEAEDGIGQSVKRWKDLKTVWADFYPIRTGEYQEAEQKRREEVTYKAKLRYLPGIDASLRILFRGRIFLIEKVVNVDEADYKLEIECTEYVEKEVLTGSDGSGDTGIQRTAGGSAAGGPAVSGHGAEGTGAGRKTV